MKLVYNWLKDFVGVTAPSKELASRLALSGTNIAGVEEGSHGAVIDAEVSSNRPDCLGHYGVAREIAAVYRLSLKPVAPKPKESAAQAAGAVRVEIQSPELCGRFTARVIRGAKVQPSPARLKERLEACGVDSINNVVDATNYVMLELGHPLHAFDYDLVRGHSIIVRAAKAKEKMRTLDGIERQLDPHVCLVCDGDGTRAVGIGGIMGGAETEISFSTKNVLIECAWFEPVAIRRAAKLLKLHTEASTRFGRGADPEMAEVASRRCAELILELAGGELLAGVVDVYPGKRGPKRIALRRSELLRVMGADVPDEEIEAILSALGFSPVRVDAQRGSSGSLLAAWECTQPSWRADVEREIDLIEEIARIHGLDKFPPRGRDSGADRQSAIGRCKRLALHRRGDDGRGARMEPQSWPAQRAALRNRTALPARRPSRQGKPESCPGRDARPDPRRDRRGPRKGHLRGRPRIRSRGLEGRHGHNRRPSRRPELGRGGAELASSHAPGRDSSTGCHSEPRRSRGKLREESFRYRFRRAASKAHGRTFETTPGSFPRGAGTRSFLRRNEDGEGPSPLPAAAAVPRCRAGFLAVAWRRHALRRRRASHPVARHQRNQLHRRDGPLPRQECPCGKVFAARSCSLPEPRRHVHRRPALRFQQKDRCCA